MVVDRFRNGKESAIENKPTQRLRAKSVSPFIGPLLNLRGRFDCVVHHGHDVRFTTAPVPHQDNGALRAICADRAQSSLNVRCWICN